MMSHLKARAHNKEENQIKRKDFKDQEEIIKDLISTEVLI